MPTPEFIDSQRLRGAVSMADAVDALEVVFAGPLPLTPQRSRLTRDDDSLLLMPSWDAEAAGVKLVTVNESNPARGLPLIHGVYVLFTGDTLEPVALFDAAPLTALRTAAVSALATKYLARADARDLVIFGAGIQAAAHVEAMRTVRNIERVTIVSRTEESARKLVDSISSEVETAVGRPDDVSRADIVCTCTTATTPLFAGSLLPPGCHVNAVGSHRPSDRELDSTAVRKSSVFVETEQAAVAEAGDLLIPMSEAGGSEVTIKGDLSEVVSGLIGRSGSDEITLLKTVGVAFEDLAVALAAAKVLVERLRPQ